MAAEVEQIYSFSTCISYDATVKYKIATPEDRTKRVEGTPNFIHVHNCIGSDSLANSVTTTPTTLAKLVKFPQRETHHPRMSHALSLSGGFRRGIWEPTSRTVGIEVKNSVRMIIRTEKEEKDTNAL